MSDEEVFELRDSTLGELRRVLDGVAARPDSARVLVRIRGTWSRSGVRIREVHVEDPR